jgi:hypothetical protein
MPLKRHDCRMGSGRITPMTPSLVSTVLPREPSSSPLNPPTPTADNAASSPRHVLPSDLPAAIKHLNDQELGQLMAAVTAEQERRGKKPPSHAKTPSKGPVEAVAVPLTPGKLRQFALPSKRVSDLRKLPSSLASLNRMFGRCLRVRGD